MITWVFIDLSFRWLYRVFCYSRTGADLGLWPLGQNIVRDQPWKNMYSSTRLPRPACNDSQLSSMRPCLVPHSLIVTPMRWLGVRGERLGNMSRCATPHAHATASRRRRHGKPTSSCARQGHSAWGSVRAGRGVGHRRQRVACALRVERKLQLDG
jgi:hypothetical protein